MVDIGWVYLGQWVGHIPSLESLGRLGDSENREKTQPPMKKVADIEVYNMQ